MIVGLSRAKHGFYIIGTSTTPPFFSSSPFLNPLVHNARTLAQDGKSDQNMQKAIYCEPYLT
jgi:hypothetical protein